MPFMRGRREQMQNAPGAEQRQNEAGREQVPNQFGMRQMPGGIEREQMPDRPGREEISNRDGTKQIQNQETKEQNSNESGMQQIPNGFGAQGRFGGFIGGFGRMGARGGADLKYIDDSPSSYWAIRNNAVFRTTTDADFKKVIEMIKKLNEGTDLEKYLDVDEILRFWAVNTFLSIWMVTVEVCITIIIFMKRTGCFQFCPGISTCHLPVWNK